MGKPQTWNFRDHDVNRYDSRQEQPDAHDVPHLGILLEKLAEVRTEMAASRPAYEATAPRTFGGAVSDTGPAGTCANPFGTACEVAILNISIDASTGINVAAISTSPNLNALQVAAVNGTTTLQGDIPFLYLACVSTSAPGVPHWFPLAPNEALYLYSSSSPTGSGAKGVYATVQFRRRVNPAGVPNMGYS